MGYGWIGDAGVGQLLQRSRRRGASKHLLFHRFRRNSQDCLFVRQKSNLPAEELASYNAVVDSGNKEAISWALKAMQARQVAPESVVEPQLYGGGAPTDTVVRFESQQQVLDAMNKRNDRGQRLYDVDEAYRNKVAMILHASPDF